MSDERVETLHDTFSDPDDRVRAKRKRRRMALAVWCVPVGFAETVLGALLFKVPHPRDRDWLMMFAIFAALLVFTVPLFWWARYPDLTMDERMRLKELGFRLSSAGRISARDVCKAYRVAQLLVKPDVYETVTSESDGTTFTSHQWRVHALDYIEYEKGRGLLRFPIACRWQPLPREYQGQHYNSDDSLIDRGNHLCVLEVQGDRARLLPDDGSVARDGDGGGVDVCTDRDSVREGRRYRSVVVAFLSGQAEALGRGSFADSAHRNPLEGGGAFLPLVVSAVFAPFGLALGIESIVRAKYCLRRSDRFFSVWFGVWSSLVAAGVLLYISYDLLVLMFHAPVVFLVPFWLCMAFIGLGLWSTVRKAGAPHEERSGRS